MSETCALKVRQVIKSFVLDEFLSGEDPAELAEDVELMTLGILDSVGVLKMVSFLENRFCITIAPHELGRAYMNTLHTITSLVTSKIVSTP